MTTYLLPQSDKSPDRKLQLESVRKQYGYDYTYGLPISTKINEIDKAGALWTIKALKAMFKDRSNLEAILKTTGWVPQIPLKKKSALEIAGHLKKKEINVLLGYYIQEMGPLNGGGRPATFDDYKKVFQKVQAGYTVDLAFEDSYFVHSFLAGPNPNMLKKMKSVPANLPLTQAVFQSSQDAFASDDLNRAIEGGRVFFVDYYELSDLNPGVHPNGSKKYVFQPIVVFARPEQGDALLPVAIQCGQDPRAYPLMSPRDQWSWQIAKSTAWVAHYCYQEMLTHLSWTHLLVEPIAVATRRHLHVSHPIYGLLSPHFEGTLPINSLAISSLIQPGQAVDRLVGSDKDSNYALIAKGRLGYSFSSNYLPKRLATMGVLSTKDIPSYHYRDDALLIWDAVAKWVTSYVDIVYASDAAIRSDFELQSWAKEISNEGKVKDFAANGGISDRNQLIETLTMIIFTAGPQHAAVNFAQITDISFVPTGPLAGYRPAPESKTLSEQDYLDFLPPLDVAIKQWQSLYFLGSVNHSNLGVYPLGQFLNPKVVAANVEFTARLVKIEAEITLRNLKRMPYTHLLPSRIPQSTNI